MRATATAVAVTAALLGVSHVLKARDDAVLIAAIAKRAPVPSHARMTTIAHDAETMAKIASAMPGAAPESFVPSFGECPATLLLTLLVQPSRRCLPLPR